MKNETKQSKECEQNHTPTSTALVPADYRTYIKETVSLEQFVVDKSFRLLHIG